MNDFFQIRNLIKMSRPRFWLYAAGTFMVGAAAGVDRLASLNNWLIIATFVYFIFLGNIYIYGINDLFDDDTDKYNDKKGDQEYFHQQKQNRWLKTWVIISLTAGVALAILSASGPAKIYWAAFLILAGCYSAPPLRFKAQPIIDAASNVHYALIGAVGYALASGQYVSSKLLLAAGLWTAAMHIYSAILDIEADAKAGLKTTAVWLGAKTSLLLCSVLWFGSAIMIFTQTGSIWLGLIGALYAAAPLLLLQYNEAMVKKVYWAFPYLNALAGMALFWYSAWGKW